MKIKHLYVCLVLVSACISGEFVARIVPAYFETIIERKAQDRITEEKEKMAGKLAYCEKMCRI